MDLPELIASNLAHYEALATQFATTPALLAELRARLSDRRSSSPLFDSARYARGLESAYAAMWRRFHAGEPADDLTLLPPP